MLRTVVYVEAKPSWKSVLDWLRIFHQLIKIQAWHGLSLNEVVISTSAQRLFFNKCKKRRQEVYVHSSDSM